MRAAAGHTLCEFAIKSPLFRSLDFVSQEEHNSRECTLPFNQVARIAVSEVCHNLSLWAIIVRDAVTS